MLCCCCRCICCCCCFFFNDTATTEIYTLSLHDALPISHVRFLLMSVLICYEAMRFPLMRPEVLAPIILAPPYLNLRD